MERHDRRLQPETGDEQRGRQQEDGVGPAPRGQQQLELGEFQRAQVQVHDPQADEDQTRGHHRQQQVLERRLDAVPLQAERHQDVGGDGDDLQVHVQAEQVAHQQHAVQAEHHQQEQRVEFAPAVVVVHVVDGVEDAEEPDDVDHHEKQQAQTVHGELRVQRPQRQGLPVQRDEPQAQADEAKPGQRGQDIRGAPMQPGHPRHQDDGGQRQQQHQSDIRNHKLPQRRYVPVDGLRQKSERPRSPAPRSPSPGRCCRCRRAGR